MFATWDYLEMLKRRISAESGKQTLFQRGLGAFFGRVSPIKDLSEGNSNCATRPLTPDGGEGETTLASDSTGASNGDAFSFLQRCLLRAFLGLGVPAILLSITGVCRAQAILPNLLYYPLLENSGNTDPLADPLGIPLATADGSGNGTTGWFYENGGAVWAPNQVGASNALHFDGVSSYLYTTNNASRYSFTTNNYSIGLVMRPNNNDWIPLFGNVNPNDPNQYGWYVAEWNGGYEIHLENNGTETVARQAGYSANGWGCSTIAAAGTNISICCNGLMAPLNYYLYGGSTFNYPAPSPVPVQFCELAPGVEDLNGDVSAIAIWDHALSFYEQQEWYNANMPNMIEEWKLWGNSDDTSCYSNAPATLVGNPSYVTGPDGLDKHALYLNGTSQYLTESNYMTYPVTSFGISFWIKPAAITGSEDLFQWADDANHNYSIQTGILGTSGVLYCRLWAGPNTWFDISSLPVETNVWNHVEISWFGWQANNCYPIFRINGVVDTNLTVSPSGIYGGQAPPQNYPAVVTPLNGVPLNFGLRSDNSSEGGNPYHGAVSDVQFYINGLSDYENSLIYNSMLTSNYVGHIGPPGAGSVEILPPQDAAICTNSPSAEPTNQTVTITPDLLYWPFLENIDNSNPTNVPLATADDSGNGTTGWFYEIDGTDWTPNQIGVSNAVHFHGVGSYIVATNNASLYSFTTNNFSIGLVMHPYGSAWLPLLGNVNSNNPSQYGWYVAEGNGDFEIHFENNGQETIARQANLPAIGWSCVTISAAGTNISISCNGFNTAVNYSLNGSTFNTPAPSASPLQFCDNASDVQDLDGDLSSVAIWSRALSFYEQQEWYNANMPNLIQEWKLWGNANDTSFYTNAPATLAGNPGYTTGPDGVANHALYLNGGQYISQANYNKIPISAFSVSFWIKPDPITGSEDLFQWADDGNHNYSIQTGILGTSGVLYCRLWAENDTWYGISSLPVVPNQWNHVEISWFGWQTNNCYPIFRINGVLDTSEVTSTGTQVPLNVNPEFVNSLNGVPLNFGLRSDNVANDGNPFQGAVSDVQLYLNGLSNNESSMIYNSMVNSNATVHVGPPFAGSIQVLPNVNP
jgi:hypothetical protein